MTLEEGIAEMLAGAEKVLVFASETGLSDGFDDVETVVVSDDDGDVSLPLDFDRFEDRVRYGVEGALENGILEEGEDVVVVDDVFDSEPDTFSRFKVTESVRSGLYSLFTDSKAEPSVIRDVVELSIELGKKGQKGKPIGALFVVGDAGNVMDKSRELSYNPFEKSHVHVGDPIVNVMLKEFSRLDGAFVISDSGKIVSAYRYLEADGEGVDIPRGLGTRHMAAASITRDTNAVSVVLSESDRMVRVFKGGELVLELDPEEY
ncbi:MAG: diadenylate cyclase domain-containing protein [Halobacteriales archaeon]